MTPRSTNQAAITGAKYPPIHGANYGRQRSGRHQCKLLCGVQSHRNVFEDDFPSIAVLIFFIHFIHNHACLSLIKSAIGHKRGPRHTSQRGQELQIAALV
jgi:hypothetical protein